MKKIETKIDIKHVDDEAMSIHKRKRGKGYQYFDEDGNKIKDKLLLSRFRRLIIPPMWTDVYICKWDDGHIQAIGRDAKGRKQYIYHSEFEKSKQEEKFAKMKAFGKSLKKFRIKVLEDIAEKEWNKNKVLALIILLLDETGIRIGNKQYVNQNGTFGLTTLRRKHITFEKNQVVFEYKGKSNQMRHVEIDDVQLAKLIKKTSELPGYEIFRYKNDDGQFQAVDSDDVNEYIHAHMGKGFSSKDFRTWVASRLAVELYPYAIEAIGETKKSKFSNALIRMVADELGNTPKVCRSYYVHPNIMQKIESKSLPNKYYEDKGMKQSELTLSEKEVMKHL
ncbi:DNA topoisomerase IB [Flavobacterium galactosidilyticum]|uniref:DNA topoisomerase IB n=1 Tax=Flavobacterium galactosidilyticum TaxID=2893886 RepID=UPI001E29848F|nr:DNA topoisomerase IB [Flavobacterium sp. F-340]UFH45769.1 DNA topoisomerase IB [Flavobacterium sp. F-340]